MPICVLACITIIYVRSAQNINHLFCNSVKRYSACLCSFSPRERDWKRIWSITPYLTAENCFFINWICSTSDAYILQKMKIDGINSRFYCHILNNLRTFVIEIPLSRRELYFCSTIPCLSYFSFREKYSFAKIMKLTQ